MKLESVIPYSELRTLVEYMAISGYLQEMEKPGKVKLTSPILYLSVVSLRGGKKEYLNGETWIREGEIEYIASGLCIGIDNSTSSSLVEPVFFKKEGIEDTLEVERHSKKKGIILSLAGPEMRNRGGNLTVDTRGISLSREGTYYVGSTFGQDYILCNGISSLKKVLEMYAPEMAERFLKELLNSLEKDKEQLKDGITGEHSIKLIDEYLNK
ncbi:MAG: hypothetical protein J7K73_00145 [Nanoarchaeota archaeon]|nr:hypothetical protein [Nanoarchaeota archaeon]